MRSEDDLRAAMQLLALDAPTVEDVMSVVNPAQRRRRAWILPAAAALVTLAGVVTVTALVSSGPTVQPAQVRKPPSTPTALVRPHWVLMSVRPDGEASTPGGGSLLIRSSGQFAAGFPCGSWRGVARFDGGRATFNGAFVNTDCPNSPRGDAATVRTVEAVLDGTVRWSVQGARLTITKPGIGILTYAPYGSSATITGRLLAVGGPASVPARPLNGTVTVTQVGGRATHTITVGSDGKYTVHVAPGRYHVQGHSPLYQDGKYPCNALKPADAAAATTTMADVYCQEK